jgi:hypothetical protein
MARVDQLVRDVLQRDRSPVLAGMKGIDDVALDIQHLRGLADRRSGKRLRPYI